MNMEERTVKNTSNRNGGTFIIADLPPTSIEFGIDSISYETGPKFKGIGLLPKGLHFVYYSTGMGARQGFFISCNDDIQVKCWDSASEEISMTMMLSDQSMSNLLHSMNLGELNDNIGPYPYHQHQVWKNLTSYINQRVLARADADIESHLYPGDAQDITDIFIKSKANVNNKHYNNTQVAPYFAGQARVARYCHIRDYEAQLREKINSDSSNPHRAKKLTDINMDKSDLLDTIIASFSLGNADDILGEVQLAFIMFINLYSYPALEHWKTAIHMICTSERYLLSNALFTIGFIRMLYEQLNFVPQDFFEDELSKANFLAPSLTALFSALSNISSDSIIYEHKKRLYLYASKKFDFHEDLFDHVDVVDEGLREYMSGYHSGETGSYMEATDIWNSDIPVIVDIVDESNTMDVDHDHDHDDVSMRDPISSSSTLPLTTEEQLYHKYSWRYPLLFESMQGSELKEDCFMAAARIIDQYGFLLNDDASDSINQQLKLSDKDRIALNSLVTEAKMFIEHEVSDS